MNYDRSNVKKEIGPKISNNFSAITSSLRYQDKNSVMADSGSSMTYNYDEFGFKKSNGSKQMFKLLKTPYVEDNQNKLRWIAVFEIYKNQDMLDFLDQPYRGNNPRNHNLRKLIYTGVPHSLRSYVWMRVSGAVHKKVVAKMTYEDIVKVSNNDGHTSVQIENDLIKSMPNNACFKDLDSAGTRRLQRLIRGFTWLYSDIGYCKSIATISATMLLFLEEDDAFWMMVAIIENLLPPSYYSTGYHGIREDQRVIRILISKVLPDIYELLILHDIEIGVITFNWFFTLFASVVHIPVLLRFWDLFLLEGSTALFHISLGMLKIKEDELRRLQNSSDIIKTLSEIPENIDDLEYLLRVCFEISEIVTDSIVSFHRNDNLSHIMVHRNEITYSMQTFPFFSHHQRYSYRKQPKGYKTFFTTFFSGNEKHIDSEKYKNVKQTEMLVVLRDAVARLVMHFMSLDPKLSDISAIPDYTKESHSKDHDNYINTSKTRLRRAKALLDFERHDDDELGFRKNDVITILSKKDEHCWVGELNGLTGWFPAKFVELLDERSKFYTCAGDDTINEVVTDLVRGGLCPAVKAILEHGMRKPTFLIGSCHPWLFIEEVSNYEIQKDFRSVYSRLILCKTYRLDEDGKVLTPEELLYRCVQSINLSHDDAHVQMDVKLRSLICLGLNEQVFHLWLEIFCSCLEVVQKWYYPWSFMHSPGWVQIKCELRTLCNFAFNLNPDLELPEKSKRSQHLKDGVRDMLVKHHLFSWDL